MIGDLDRKMKRVDSRNSPYGVREGRQILLADGVLQLDVKLETQSVGVRRSWDSLLPWDVQTLSPNHSFS